MEGDMLFIPVIPDQPVHMRHRPSPQVYYIVIHEARHRKDGALA